MTDCFNEDEEGDDEEDVSEPEEAPEKQPIKSSPKKTHTSTQNSGIPTAAASPAKAIGVVEYIVDQKGVGSESLVVKSAANKTTAVTGIGYASPSHQSSRRSSLVSPRRTVTRPNYGLPNTPKTNTTHSHPLFPNYSRTIATSLPTYDPNQLSLNADLGLATLNVSDFSLNAELWNAGLFPLEQEQTPNYDPYATYTANDSIPRYHQQPANSRTVLFPPTQAASLEPASMTNIVSDLFGDVSMF